MFDRFFRGANARGQQGSGLGLAIVRQVAEQHGGSVNARMPPTAARSSRIGLPTMADDQIEPPGLWSQPEGVQTGIATTTAAVARGRDRRRRSAWRRGLATRACRAAMNRLRSNQNRSAKIGTATTISSGARSRRVADRADQPDRDRDRGDRCEQRRVRAVAGEVLARRLPRARRACTPRVPRSASASRLGSATRRARRGPAKIAISDTGTPPNGLVGRSPSVPSWRCARWVWRAACTSRSARCSRRCDGTARGARCRSARFRERRFDFWPAKVR